MEKLANVRGADAALTNGASGPEAPDLGREIASYMRQVVGDDVPSPVIEEALSVRDPSAAAERAREAALGEVSRRMKSFGQWVGRLAHLRPGCDLVPGLLSARAANRISADGAVTLYRHLDRCPDCAELTARFNAAEWSLNGVIRQLVDPRAITPKAAPAEALGFVPPGSDAPPPVDVSNGLFVPPRPHRPPVELSNGLFVPPRPPGSSAAPDAVEVSGGLPSPPTAGRIPAPPGYPLGRRPRGTAPDRRGRRAAAAVLALLAVGVGSAAALGAFSPAGRGGVPSASVDHPVARTPPPAHARARAATHARAPAAAPRLSHPPSVKRHKSARVVPVAVPVHTAPTTPTAAPVLTPVHAVPAPVRRSPTVQQHVSVAPPIVQRPTPAKSQTPAPAKPQPKPPAGSGGSAYQNTVTLPLPAGGATPSGSGSVVSGGSAPQ